MAAFETGLQLAGKVRTADATIQTAPFLELCRQSLKIIEKLVGGPGCMALKYDINRNIQRIAARAAADPGAGGDLFQVVLNEVAASEKGPNCVSAVSLLWLTRSMQFTVGGLLLLYEDQELSMGEAITRSYSRTLEPYHTWVLIQVFRAGLHFVHSRRRFFRNLGVEGESEAAGLEALGAYCATFGALLAEVHRFLVEHGLNNEAKRCHQFLSDKLPPGCEPMSVVRDFRAAVNMSPEEIEAFLASDESRQAVAQGDDADKEGRHIARRIVELLNKEEDTFYEGDFEQMYQIAAYINCHKGATGEIKGLDRAHLKNFGYDPAKATTEQ